MLINLRNALMAGKRLPYDAEVEFLQSDGQAFVNTGFVVEEGSKITCNIGMASSYGSTYGYFGASDGTGSYLGGGFNCTSPFSDRRLSVWLKNYLYWCLSANSTNVYQDGALHTMQFETSPTIQSVAFDGTAIPYGAGFQSGVGAMPSIPTYLFAVNSAGTSKIVPASAAVKIGSFRVEKNDEIKLDVIAVRKGTVGYLYDRVSGKLFGNAGTGDFVLGPDVVPVEYIESTGTQYIDTGLLGRDGYDFEYRIRPMNPLPSGIGGEYENDKNCYIGLVRSNGYLAYNYYSPNNIVEVQPLTLGMDYNVKAHLYSGEQYFEVNGVRGGVGSRTGAFTSSYNLYLFAINSANQPTSLGVMRLYNFTAHLNTIPTRSFRPVRVGTDATSWEGAMMDTLTRRIYRNAGTGAFTFGNDTSWPTA